MSTVTNQFMGQGEVASSSNYFYTNDYSGSIREVCDARGSIQGQFVYDCFGRETRVQGTISPSFKFTGLYDHSVSGLSLALSRVYSSSLGRWLSRDGLVPH